MSAFAVAIRAKRTLVGAPQMSGNDPKRTCTANSYVTRKQCWAVIQYRVTSAAGSAEKFTRNFAQAGAFVSRGNLDYVLSFCWQSNRKGKIAKLVVRRQKNREREPPMVTTTAQKSSASAGPQQDKTVEEKIQQF